MTTSKQDSIFRRPLATLAIFLLATTIVVANAENNTITLPWCKPASGSPYESRAAKVGDTVVFTWEATAHNVLIHPSGECLDYKDKEFISEQTGASYTFTEDDAGTTKTFVCSISDHCVRGQIVNFDVKGSDEEVEYDLSTDCGSDGTIGVTGAETEPPVDGSSAGTSVGGGVVAGTITAVLSAWGAILLA